MCRRDREAGEWVKRKRARDDRKGKEVLLCLLGYPAEGGSLSGGERERGVGRATGSIDLVSDYHFMSRCLLDVISQFDAAEIACEHRRKG